MKSIIKNKFKFAFLFIISTSIISCNKNDDNFVTTKAYQQTIVPTNIEDLYEGKGDVSKDTVIVYAEGGPEPSLIAGDIEELQFNNYYRVYVKQAQHINSTIAQNEISFTDAVTEDSISTEIFYGVLKHFKDQNKVVIAMSHSFGSFILPNVLATKPNIADKYIIMAGRLDMPDVVWQGFRDGMKYSFGDNGVTPVADGGSTNIGGKLSFSRLQAGLGQNRYTELLADKDLSNLFYIYGEYDEPVGRLNTEEIDFLNSKSVRFAKINEGDHSAMFHPDGLNFIVDMIIRN